jgi:anti-anti-sigma factor
MTRNRGELFLVLGHSVVVEGDIDSTNGHLFRAVLDKAARSGPRFSVDLVAVRYLDCAGVRVLEEFAAWRPRVIVRAGSAVERVLRILAVNSLVPLHPTAASA